jgi:hypothetical protein
METAEPHLAEPRIDKLLPRERKSKADSEDPSLDEENIE